jgi:hypothetical protein
MANVKYDQVGGLVASGSFNWRADQVYALLFKGASYVSTHTRLDQVKAGGGSQVSSTMIEGRYVGIAGEAMGLPATFPKIAKDIAYQVLVACDLGDSNPQLIAFYDRDNDNATLTVANNGTFILRPTIIEGAEPPTAGMWMQL